MTRAGHEHHEHAAPRAALRGDLLPEQGYLALEPLWIGKPAGVVLIAKVARRIARVRVQGHWRASAPQVVLQRGPGQRRGEDGIARLGLGADRFRHHAVADHRPGFIVGAQDQHAETDPGREQRVAQRAGPHDAQAQREQQNEAGKDQLVGPAGDVVGA